MQPRPGGSTLDMRASLLLSAAALQAVASATPSNCSSSHRGLTGTTIPCTGFAVATRAPESTTKAEPRSSTSTRDRNWRTPPLLIVCTCTITCALAMASRPQASTHLLPRRGSSQSSCAPRGAQSSASPSTWPKSPPLVSSSFTAVLHPRKRQVCPNRATAGGCSPSWPEAQAAAGRARGLTRRWAVARLRSHGKARPGSPHRTRIQRRLPEKCGGRCAVPTVTATTVTSLASSTNSESTSSGRVLGRRSTSSTSAWASRAVETMTAWPAWHRGLKQP
mmetsp:Transcript_109629/g.349792  ORF Transcript_109629/g.349792 Transcript_109629/m.349792 type:complete len:278 (-) Transcript_109629:20-853(-)